MMHSGEVRPFLRLINDDDAGCERVFCPAPGLRKKSSSSSSALVVFLSQFLPSQSLRVVLSHSGDFVQLPHTHTRTRTNTYSLITGALSSCWSACNTVVRMPGVKMDRC